MNTPVTAVMPVSTADDAIDEIVSVAKRVKSSRLRHEFLQQRHGPNGVVVPGPFAGLVKSGDLSALKLYLLLVTKASAPPWDAALPAVVWARALGMPETKTSASTISKTWLRLEKRNLVQRTRHKRMADVTLLREDGTGTPYSSPGDVNERYFQVPIELWTTGPNALTRWYRELSLPEFAVLLIGRSLGDEFHVPFEKGPGWYGVSADTLSRGLHGLEERGLLYVERRYEKAPLSPTGWKDALHCTLEPPLGPVGRVSGKRAKKSGGAKRHKSGANAAKVSNKATTRATTEKNPRRKASR